MPASDLRPLVSVVIPCHNRASALAGAVRSAVARSARVQVVVVDDGSTDGTAAVARALDVILVRQPRHGSAAARNRGLQAATGEFVIFLDPDDRLLDCAIDTGMRALNSRPGCAMAYGRGVLAGADGDLLSAPEVPLVRAGHHAALLRTNLIWMTALAIFRRDAVERAGGFRPGFDEAADYDLYLRISRDASVLDHGLLVATCGRPAGSALDRTQRMLRDTLEVMRQNRPDPHTPLHDAWREGYVLWQDFYGTHLVYEFRSHVRGRAFANALGASLALLSLAPWVFARSLVGRESASVAYRVENSIAVPPPSSNLPSSFI
jgi:glycosyltransferase involved in cell wall biosynthesis